MLTFTYLQFAAILAGAVLLGVALGITIISMLIINRDSDKQSDDDYLTHVLEHYGLGLNVQLIDGIPHWVVVDVEGSMIGSSAPTVYDAIKSAHN